MDRVYFTINGKQYSAGSEFTVDTTLTEFIRRYADLRGTKYMCMEAGCGACVVNERISGANEGEDVSFSVNSCLVIILSCNNWNITTIEAIGNRTTGYNIIQKRLHHYFGSQCGYCSPGFVMSMYSLLQEKHDLTEKEIEESFGGNLCRCTGYRPILEAFKSLAVDVNPTVLKKIQDIEDTDKHFCPKSGKDCNESCTKEFQEWCVVNVKSGEMQAPNPGPKQITLADGKLWYTVYDVQNIFEILNQVGYESYMLVAGNTARGVKPMITYPNVLIDISQVKELQTHYLDVNLVLGANMTLTDTLKLFKQLSESNEEFWYLQQFYDHIKRVGHIPVRNMGTLAGNLVLKHKFPEFQSDLFLLFDCVGAIITIVDAHFHEVQLSFEEFLTADIVGKVLTHIKLPPLSKHNKLVTYKITPREENAHAEVNSSFLFEIDPRTLLISKARIVYGGITPSFTHAHATENFVIGQNIFNNRVLQGALHCLQLEINPIENPPEPSAAYRKKLAISLFYKCIIKLCPPNILNPRFKTGSTTPSDDRPPVSQSYQEYDTEKNIYPITQPLLKKEGLIQCSGEAEYSDDLSTMKGEVFASFVLSTVPGGEIQSVDESLAMKIQGVITVLSATDIPGNNSFIRAGFTFYTEKEELLVSDKVRYYNQPVAIVVAKTQAIADRAANFVKVQYKKVSERPMVITIDDAINAPKDENRIVSHPGITPQERGVNVKRVLHGHFVSPPIYHFMMELHTTVTKPVDDGLEVYTSTQYIEHVQAVVAQILNMPENLVTVISRRSGGGFGCKLSRSNVTACATALVSRKLNRPCRMAMRMPDTMRASGKRRNSQLDYEVGVDDNGEIQYLNGTFYVNEGNGSNENENGNIAPSFQNCYNFRRWKLDNFAAITDTPVNTFMRGPGKFQGIAAIEHIMEHIAIELNKDPMSVRMVNYRKENNPFHKLLPMFIKKIDYQQRKDFIEKFNAQNRWKKRGLKFMNSEFPVNYTGNYSALIAVYQGDGSVIVNIGGIEIGQGIYTRIGQVAANELKIPVEKVKVLPTANIATPNNFGTGSSITTECCAYAVIKACEKINARIAPFREEMPNGTWQEIVSAAHNNGISLQANYYTSDQDPRLVSYTVYGMSAIEIEIDVLTGRKWIVRADVFEDTGRSINPALDLGQVEGGFVQGVSSWILEDLKYNKTTGEIYTDRSWNYNIFGAKDIPHDFRVYFRRQAPNPVGILGSRAVGEPPVCLGYSVVDSLREAIRSSRAESGYKNTYINLDIPVSNEVVLDAVDVKIEEYVLY